MEFQVDKEADVVVLRATGRLDAVNGPELEAAAGSVMEGGDCRFVIDMSGVPYISSAGLGALLKTAKRAKTEGGRIAIAALGDSVNKVFELSGFLTLFLVRETAAEACSALAAGETC